MSGLNTMIKAALIGLAGAFAIGSVALAQGAATPSLTAVSGILRIDLDGQTTQSVALPRGKSMIIDLPVDVADVHVTNAAISDIVPAGPRRLYVMGLNSGQTDAMFFDRAGRRILSL